ncbi:MAG: hypothetical protein J6T47_10840 [Lachnospiraceae bacterium]|nr:hypothetical protein [Lachnospiraceae bacterium]
MKEKIGYIFLGLLFAVCIFLMFRNGYGLLADSSRKQKVSIVAITGGIDYSHKFEGIIPLGTDHYRLGMDQESGKIYILRASQKWFDNNFPGGISKEPGGIAVTAVQCKVSDSDLRAALKSDMNEVSILARGSDGSKYLFINPAPLAIFAMSLAIGGVLGVILAVLILVKADSIPQKLKNAFGVYLLVYALLLVYFLMRYGLLMD